MSLRGSMVLLAVVGAVLPLGLVGLWLIRSAELSGEELLRARLRQSLREIVPVAGARWVDLRSELFDAALAWSEGSGPEARRDSMWRGLDGRVERLELFDHEGGHRLTLERGGPEDRNPATLPLTVTLRNPEGEPAVTFTAWVRTSVLLPGDAILSGVGGGVLGVYTQDGRVSALPSSMQSDLLLEPTFAWNDDEWVSEQHAVSEPSLLLALAAPVSPFTAPFAQAVRKGTLALILVVVGSSILAMVAATRLTRPLEELADAADAVARGDLSRTVRGRGPAEVGRLARAFNTMTDSLRATLARLSQREAVAAVGEFAATLAHEVRNPLSSIRLDLQRATERLPPDHRAQALVERALKEIRRLDATVDGALRMARSGRVELSPMDAAGPIRAAMTAATPRFRERGAVLEKFNGLETGVHVQGDPAALEQAVLNLLLNAADALPPGGRARVRAMVDGADLRIQIEDEGEGIRPELLERLWEPFFTTRPEGTGLGLPMARRMANAMGGDVNLSSQYGRGTVVTLVLPISPTARREPQA